MNIDFDDTYYQQSNDRTESTSSDDVLIPTGCFGKWSMSSNKVHNKKGITIITTDNDNDDDQSIQLLGDESTTLYGKQRHKSYITSTPRVTKKNTDKSKQQQQQQQKQSHRLWNKSLSNRTNWSYGKVMDDTKMTINSIDDMIQSLACIVPKARVVVDETTTNNDETDREWRKTTRCTSTDCTEPMNDNDDNSNININNNNSNDDDDDDNSKTSVSVLVSSISKYKAVSHFKNQKTWVDFTDSLTNLSSTSMDSSFCLNGSTSSLMFAAYSFSTSPEEYLDTMIYKRGYSTQRYSVLESGYYNDPTEIQEMCFTDYVRGLVWKNDVSTIQALLKCGMFNNPCGSFGESLVHEVCQRGKVDVLRTMIEFGCDVRVSDASGSTPLHELCRNKNKPNIELIDILLKEDVRLFQMKDTFDSVPLQYVPRKYWLIWNEYIDSRKDIFWPLRDCTKYGQQPPPPLTKMKPNTRIHTNFIGNPIADLPTLKRLCHGEIKPSDVLSIPIQLPTLEESMTNINSNLYPMSSSNDIDQNNDSIIAFPTSWESGGAADISFEDTKLDYSGCNSDSLSTFLIANGTCRGGSSSKFIQTDLDYSSSYDGSFALLEFPNMWNESASELSFDIIANDNDKSASCESTIRINDNAHTCTSTINILDPIIGQEFCNTEENRRVSLSSYTSIVSQLLDDCASVLSNSILDSPVKTPVTNSKTSRSLKSKFDMLYRSPTVFIDSDDEMSFVQHDMQPAMFDCEAQRVLSDSDDDTSIILAPDIFSDDNNNTVQSTKESIQQAMNTTGSDEGIPSTENSNAIEGNSPEEHVHQIGNIVKHEDDHALIGYDNDELDHLQILQQFAEQTVPHNETIQTTNDDFAKEKTSQFGTLYDIPFVIDLNQPSRFYESQTSLSSCAISKQQQQQLIVVTKTANDVDGVLTNNANNEEEGSAYSEWTSKESTSEYSGKFIEDEANNNNNDSIAGVRFLL